jgi:hypothetical protein
MNHELRSEEQEKEVSMNTPFHLEMIEYIEKNRFEDSIVSLQFH